MGGTSVQVQGWEEEEVVEDVEGAEGAGLGAGLPEELGLLAAATQGQRLQVCWQLPAIQGSPHLPHPACSAQE